MERNKLHNGQSYAFGFLVIDVCESSKYGDTGKQQMSKFLEKFVEAKIKGYDGMKLHWALDGGECGFIGNCDSMAMAARDILVELNSERLKNTIIDFSVRICLHHGSVKWAESFQNVSGTEFSWICKNEKKIGVCDAIIITKDAFDLMEDSKLKEKFSFHAEHTREDGKRMKTWIYDPICSTNLLNLAKMSYEQNLRLDQIAPQLDLSEYQINCLLETAMAKQIVTSKIYLRAPRSLELENKILKSFPHLNKVSVLDYRGPHFKQEIAKVAGDEIRKMKIEEGSPLAISCGTTIMELGKNLESEPCDTKNLKIYPLLITMTAEMEEISPAGIVSYLTRVFPHSIGYAAQFPKVEKDLDKARERKKVYAEDCKDLMDGARRAKHMFTGLGKIGSSGITHGFNALTKRLGVVKSLKELAAVGECCYQPFTIDGELLACRPELELLRANSIYIDLQELRKKVKRKGDTEILAIAGGSEKHDSVLGGLRAKVFNGLITDIETAEYVAENA